MDENYGFTDTWCSNLDKMGSILKVILGTDGEYFIQGTKSGNHRIRSTICDKIDISETWREVETLALGRDGAYILEMKKGKAFWNLHGCYGGLREFIRQKVHKERCRFRVRYCRLLNLYQN